jgi:hypothetical protein
VAEDGAMTYALPGDEPGDRDGGDASNGPDAYAGASVTQPAWGWGLALSGPRDDGDVAQALAGLPADARLYAVRQQVAERRDLGARLGSYQEYRPDPFEGTEG